MGVVAPRSPLLNFLDITTASEANKKMGAAAPSLGATAVHVERCARERHEKSREGLKKLQNLCCTM